MSENNMNPCMDSKTFQTILVGQTNGKSDAGALYPPRDAPPRTLLQFLVRMGSFTSTPKLANKDSQDDDVTWPSEQVTSVDDLLERCRQELAALPDMIPRTMCNLRPSGPTTFRVLQWNALSQALGTSNDNFVACPPAALHWSTRRYRLLQELLHHSPDVVCLQEIDHFRFLAGGLGAAGYRGTFLPKPDSPCIYLPGNNGPDGCALFYRHDRFRLLRIESRVLEVWRVASNQVALLAVLEQRASGRQLAVVTTHLKARQGTFLATLRNEQGRDLLRFVTRHCAGLPLILCGDFNAEPSEAVYQTIVRAEIGSGTGSTGSAETGRGNTGSGNIGSENTGSPEPGSGNTGNIGTGSGNASRGNTGIMCSGSGNTGSRNTVSSETGSERLVSAYTQLATVDGAPGTAEDEPPYTTWKIREEGETAHTIDYVFYSAGSLQVDGLLTLPGEEEVGVGRLPSMRFPSDHLSLVADLSFR